MTSPSLPDAGASCTWTQVADRPPPLNLEADSINRLEQSAIGIEMGTQIADLEQSI